MNHQSYVDKLGSAQDQNTKTTSSFGILVFLGLNALLAVMIQALPIISTIHVYVTMLVGLFFLINDKEPYRLINWMGYVMGAELFWRGTGANTFWETGKYILILFSFLGMLRFKGGYKPPLSVIPYFFLLLPSLFLLPAFDREQITFNLAGPLALVMTSLFFSQFSINLKQHKSLLLTTLSSVLIFSVLALIGVINAETIEFGQSSMFVTSANTGPNQASSVLALGAYAAVIFVVLEKERKFLRLVVLLLATGLITQILLTFSRGGLWTLIGALLVAGFLFLGDRRSRTAFILASAIILFLFSSVILPALDRFTAGELGERISDLDTTGRTKIVRSDWEAFLENPIFGVGVGGSRVYHARYFRVSHSHTEFSRMLAEHGILGALSLLFLIIALLKIVLQKTGNVNKAVIASCIMWSLLFMAHSATRLAAPSFLIGLSFAHFDLGDGRNSKEQIIDNPLQKDHTINLNIT